ncbi:hypothetical protein DPMN_023187 [Dreissena polymorpha]|uniref:Uncharacterized protein n=1 Tax=Dreissena polymorpha TaxID=45954 RepID=A0A9D4LMI7_DREPO|nr:hypothetical protein DPMN_023187 [Dreissena polymorpha]
MDCQGRHARPLRCQLRCPRPGDVLKPLSTYGPAAGEDVRSRPGKFPYPNLLRRCSETTILQRTITILGDSSESSRNSSASDSSPDRDVNAPAADRAMLN